MTGSLLAEEAFWHGVLREAPCGLVQKPAQEEEEWSSNAQTKVEVTLNRHYGEGVAKPDSLL